MLNYLLRALKYVWGIKLNVLCIKILSPFIPKIKYEILSKWIIK